MAVRALRYDAGELKKPEKMPNGWLKVDGLLTRTGIFTYKSPDGTVRRELRLPEEVFKADAIASFGLRPVTDDHPPRMLDATNTTQYQRGTANNPERTDDWMKANLLITDAALIAKMDAGKVQLSCGYTCELEMKPGEYQGQRYDAIQRNISGNHVAIVDNARAGPGAAVRMDAADGAMVFDSPGQAPAPAPNEGSNMRKIRIDGVEYEVSETAAQAIEKVLGQHATQIATLTGKADAATSKADTLQGKLDSVSAELVTEKAARTDAADPKKLRAAITARVGLEGEAGGILGKGVKLDSATDREIREKVIGKVFPSIVVAGKSDDYVTASYDTAIAKAKADGATGTVRVEPEPTTGNTDGLSGPDREKKSRTDMIERNNKRGLAPISIGAHKTAEG